MKARLPQGYGGGGASNLQQLARQAQKMQEQMEAVSNELEAKRILGHLWRRRGESHRHR